MNVCKEIVLCKHCKGEGFFYYQEITNHHKGEYKVTKEQCTKCDGKGRLWQITTVEYQKIT